MEKMGKEQTQIVDDLYKYIPDTSPLKPIVGNAYALILLATLVLTAINNIKISKAAVKNIAAKLDFSDLKRKKEIRQVLEDIRAICNADRVVLGYFHNGSNVGAYKLQYLTVPDIFEVVSDRAKKINGFIKNIEIGKALPDLTAYLPAGTFSTIYKRGLDNADCRAYMDRIGIEIKVGTLLRCEKAVLEIHFMGTEVPVYNQEHLESKINTLNFMANKIFGK
jgi:hypothetical protein